MQVLLANAKIMHESSAQEPWTAPRFLAEARAIAAEMAQADVAMLQRMLKCSAPIAIENWHRYRDFLLAQAMPAIFAYNGHAYKHLNAATLSADDSQYAQQHRWTT